MKENFGLGLGGLVLCLYDWLGMNVIYGQRGRHSFVCFALAEILARIRLSQKAPAGWHFYVILLHHLHLHLFVFCVIASHP